MLAIKLRRIGKKHQPSYRLIVTEKTSRPQTEGMEDLGWMNPIENKKQINAERVKYWISKGAQPSDTVYNILVEAKILEGKKRPVHKQPKKNEEGKAEGGGTAKASVAAPAEASKEAAPEK